MHTSKVTKGTTVTIKPAMFHDRDTCRDYGVWSVTIKTVKKREYQFYLLREYYDEYEPLNITEKVIVENDIYWFRGFFIKIGRKFKNGVLIQSKKVPLSWYSKKQQNIADVNTQSIKIIS